jgi:ribosomal protein S18 acetylase RimI-like enzyme
MFPDRKRWLVASVVTKVRRIVRKDYDAINGIAEDLHPRWFTESALNEIKSAVREEKGVVAIVDQKIVGFATYAPIVHERTVELTWIGVRSDLHRRGIGRALVNSLEEELRREGYEAIEVDTVAASVEYEPYARTRNFYHALGFADVRIEPSGYESGDDKLLLRRKIAA